VTPTSVVVWKWKPHAGYRSVFGPETVNVMRRMVQRHYAGSPRFICVTDDPSGLDEGIETVALWNDYAHVENPHGHPRNPSCYRRLRAFHPDIGAVFGDRFVTLDLDAVVTGDLTPLFDRDEDFVIWGDTNKFTYYNSSLFVMTAGARPQIWTDFDPAESPQASKRAGQFGSDQGWISYRLGPGEARFTRADGVYSYRNEVANNGGSNLPPDARVVFFHGQVDPWEPSGQRLAWVREHWQ